MPTTAAIAAMVPKNQTTPIIYDANPTERIGTAIKAEMSKIPYIAATDKIKISPLRELSPCTLGKRKYKTTKEKNGQTSTEILGIPHFIAGFDKYSCCH